MILSRSQCMSAAMDAAEIIALADAMRAYALEGGRDLNAANLFAHTMLMRKLTAERNAEQNNEPFAARLDCDAA